MELSDLSLEAELAALAEHAEPGRTALIAVRHWGWDGRGGTTLEVAGREHGITRERVRQLCERLAGRLAENGVHAPALDRALVLAAHAAPTTAGELARRLADDRVTARPFDPAGLLAAARTLGRQPTFRLQMVKDIRMALPDPPDPGSDTATVIASIVGTARAMVRRAGAARVRDVTGHVAAELAVWVDDALVTAVVSEPEDFAWLERRSGWFYLPSVAKNAVTSRIAKILSLTGAATLSDLHAGIRRDERMREFVMPEYILAELCERLPGLRVVGETVWSERGRSPEDVLETTELMLLRALQERGGSASRKDLEDACLGAGMKPSSFNNRLSYSPIIRDLGHGHYSLRGLAVAAAEDSGDGSDAGADYVAGSRATIAMPRPDDLESFRTTPRR